METKLITLSGRVQGVGFRYHAKKIADQHGISGYAKNLIRDVEILAQGEKEAVELFTQEVVNNPAPGSQVEDYNIESVKVDEGLNKFKTL